MKCFADNDDLKEWTNKRGIIECMVGSYNIVWGMNFRVKINTVPELLYLCHFSPSKLFCALLVPPPPCMVFVNPKLRDLS